jgi:erythromycin esterase-like protein
MSFFLTPFTDLSDVLANTSPQLLALGEPTHFEPAFPDLRNRIFELLAERGFRSIALESDVVAGLEVDAFLRGERGTLDSVMAEGFSHDFGQLDANRELVAWMRTRNDSLAPEQRLAFYGIDAPLEMAGAPSPRRYLEHLGGYLAEHLGSNSLLHSQKKLEEALGDDDRWTNPAVMMDAGKSVGASADAVMLRTIADDLMIALHAWLPRLMAASSPHAWRDAEVHGTAALGLLRYHAQAAEPASQAERMSRLLGVRDALMAQNLLAIRARERHRGPTLVFAHNRHLERHPSTMRMGGMDVEWFSAGAIVDKLLGERYTHIVGSIGMSATRNLLAPAADTYEGALDRITGGNVLVDAAVVRDRELRAREETDGNRYFPLDADAVRHGDAILHVVAFPGEPPSEEGAPTMAELAARILLLPGVTYLRADERSAAPESSWGDWFFFAGDDQRMPFATIVHHDTAGFDERSQLDRPGVFRLNFGVGREEFERLFGFPPKELTDRLEDIDFTKLDEVIPHPAYGGQGWASVLSPTAARLADVDRLLAHAHQRATARNERRA